MKRAKIMRNLTVIYLAQNRRVDITLANTGQQSVQLYPFNAHDAETLLARRPGTRQEAGRAEEQVTSHPGTGSPMTCSGGISIRRFHRERSSTKPSPRINSLRMVSPGALAGKVR